MLGYRRMPPDVGRRAIDLLFEYAQDQPEVEITHFGGEPVMNFAAACDITSTQSEANSLGKIVKFAMTSNGVLIDDEKAAYFGEHAIMVLLSIDGMRESHDRYRRDKRGDGTFDQVAAALKRLKKTQGWVGAKLTVMPANAHCLFDDVMGLHELGVNQFLVGYATGIHRGEGDMEVYMDQWKRLLEWYREEKRPEFRMTDFEGIEETSGPKFTCQAGNNSITVSVNGEASPCSKVLALNNKRLVLKLGNVWEGLTHLRNRGELTRTASLIRSCEQAGIADSYDGGCWATNYTDNQDVFQPSMQDYRFKILQKSACSGCSAH